MDNQYQPQEMRRLIFGLVYERGSVTYRDILGLMPGANEMDVDHAISSLIDELTIYVEDTDSSGNHWVYKPVASARWFGIYK